MAATAYYQNREKAFNRTSRIHRDINRATAYILDNDNTNPLSSYSRTSGRSSSLTRDAPRFVDPSNAGYRFKDKFSNESLRRSIKIPIQTSSHLSSSPSTSNTTTKGPKKVYNKDFNPYSETARYKREQEMKDIHDDFMKTWKDQQGKMNGNEEKKSKSYHKIMGTTVSALEDRDFTRQTIGDIFKDMSKFSTKTVAALSTLDTSGLNKNKNYNWRKEIEKYESTGQLERDARMRNIQIRNERNTNETDIHSRPIRTRRDESAPAPLSRRIRQSEPSPPPPQKIRSNISRIAHEPKIIPKDDGKVMIPPIVQAPEVKKEVEPPVPSTIESPQKMESLENKANQPCDKEPVSPTAMSSPLKKRAKIVKKTSKKKEKKAEKEEEDEMVTIPAPEEVSFEKKEVEIASEESTPSNEPPKKDEEEEDVHGTKKMKDDFTSRMASLDAEMTAGRSNLARIRERIRKAKKGIMEVGEMIEKS